MSVLLVANRRDISTGQESAGLSLSWHSLGLPLLHCYSKRSSFMMKEQPTISGSVPPTRVVNRTCGLRPEDPRLAAFVISHGNLRTRS